MRIWGHPAESQPPFWLAAIAIVVGATELLWPALFNGYPILFSDTQSYLAQATGPHMIWDKPFAYGPFLRLLDGGVSLWLPAVAQGLLLSHLLWLVRGVCGRQGAIRHVLLCAALAVLTGCAWFTGLLLPDIFAAVTVLCLFLLGFGDRLDRATRLWVELLATVAITVHLSHLVIAAACVVLVALVRTIRLPAVITPLLVALALLITSNLVAYGRFAVAPFGSVFLLARLTADGLVADTLARECPRPTWSLCRWVGHLPQDADTFLWDAKGPVWTTPGGPIALSREAGEIVAATLLAAPQKVLQAGLRNTARQLAMFTLGDTLHPTWLDGPLSERLRLTFPLVELARFRASRQAADTLAPVAEVFAWPILAASAGGAVVVVVLSAGMLLRGRSVRGVLAAMVLVGVMANAAATGALSGPHNRYQARIVWLLVAVPLLIGWRGSEDDA